MIRLYCLYLLLASSHSIIPSQILDASVIVCSSFVSGQSSIFKIVKVKIESCSVHIIQLLRTSIGTICYMIDSHTWEIMVLILDYMEL